MPEISCSSARWRARLSGFWSAPARRASTALAALRREDAAAGGLELDALRIGPRHVGRDDRQRVAAGQREPGPAPRAGATGGRGGDRSRRPSAAVSRRRAVRGEGARGRASRAGTLVDEAGVDLHEVGAGLPLGTRVGAGLMTPPTPMIGKRRPERRAQPGDRPGSRPPAAARPRGRRLSSPCGRCGDGVARQRRVGRDHAVDRVLRQRRGDRFDLRRRRGRARS